MGADPHPATVDSATPLAQSRMTRLYDALLHAPSGGLTTRQLSDRTGIKHREAHRLLTRMEGERLVWSLLQYPDIGEPRTNVVRMWRRTGAP